MYIRIAICVATFSYAGHASATLVIPVGSDPACMFTSIQQAVDFAAQSSDPDKQILLPSDDTFSGERIEIANQDLTLYGGIQSCGSFISTGLPTTIDGSDGTDTSILTITGTSHVVLDNLTLQNGHALSSGGGGGGINFVGNGSMALNNVGVILNSAVGGGGINGLGQNGVLDIFLNQDTTISNNTAQGGSGGGIQISGQTELYAISPRTLIILNHAPNGNGGGISIVAPATATIGSPGFNGAPVLYFNNAAYGGGISITGDGDALHLGLARLFSTDPNNAVQVADNSASVAGGGFYLKSISGGLGQTAQMCAQDFRINENVAPEGSAIYLDWDDGGVDVGTEALLNPSDPDCNPEGLAAVHCAPGVACNELSRNVSADGNGNPTNGSIVLIGTSSVLDANRVVMQSNVADNLIRVLGNNDEESNRTLKLHNCLTGENNLAHELIRVENDDSSVTIDQCTFAPDIINSTHVIQFDNAGGNSLTLVNTIIDEPGTLALSQPGISISAENLLTNDDSTLPSNFSIILGEPLFVDAAQGDYHQLPTSLGVDFAIATGGIDLDGNPRDIDLPVTNFFGPRDIGAYERQTAFACGANDTIFCDGFDG